MPRLSAVPDQPPRAIGLIRVSTERDEMVSPEIQRTAIQDQADRRGYQIVRWVEGIDESGSRRRSPWWAKLDDGVRAVESGEADVLLVWRFSRTARQRLRWAIAIDRVETAGGLLESATEPLDTSTASGRLARGMLGEMAAYEAEVIGQTWREVHARRTSKGLPANGKPRFGYEVVEGIHRPDPDVGPVLAGLYRRYIAGESVYALVEWLNREGYRTAAGYSRNGPGLWSQVTLRRCLDSGFAAGLITVAGERRRGIHEAVIDDATWRTYVATRAARRTLRRSERSQYLLSGMMRCVHQLDDGTVCGSSMGGGQFGHQRQPKFRCLAAAAQRRHAGGYVMMAVAEAAVMEWLQEQADLVDEGAVSVATRSPGVRRAARDLDTIARDVAALDQQLVTLTLQHARSIVPEAAYMAARLEIEGEKDVLARAHSRALLAAAQDDAAPLAGNLLLDWDGLLVEERRAVLRRLIARVEVEPGRPKSRITVVPGWDE